MHMLNDLKFLFNKTPAYLIFWVTQTCNFTCDHCFNYIENQKKNHDLSLDEIRKFASNLQHIKYLTMAGGEPMIRQDLAQAAEIFYRTNGLQMLNVVTNGWFTDRTLEFARTVLAKCPELFLSIHVSIDGLRETHDAIRQKPGSFGRCVATLRALQEFGKTSDGKRLSVACTGTYNAQNAQEFIETAEYITREVGVPYFMNLIRGEDVQNNSLKKIDIDHYRRTADTVFALNKGKLSSDYPYRSIRLAVVQTVNDIIYDSVKNNKMTLPCKAGKTGFVLTANGEILLCEVLDIRLGNIRQYDYDPMKVLSSPKAVEEMRKIIQDQCHCSWECFQSMNTVNSPRIYPRVAKYMLQNLLS